MSKRYTAIIRTYRSFPLVEDAIRALRQQSLPPAEVIVVDSGSPEDECTRLRALGDRFIAYPDEPFNFSKALNIGVAEVSTPFCLMLSSHYVIDDPQLIARCLADCEHHKAQAFFVTNACASGIHKVDVMSAGNFNGANGFSNTCGMVPTEAVKRRPFREDVFSCEDQEWAAWYLRDEAQLILKVSSPGIRYLNPRMNLTKTLNEELAIACFIDRSRLSPTNVAKWAARSLVSVAKGDWPRARFKLALAHELWKARHSPPQKLSRYF
jgi:glycosyltransferase involved in cell wall biosynthesis